MTRKEKHELFHKLHAYRRAARRAERRNLKEREERYANMALALEWFASNVGVYGEFMEWEKEWEAL